MIKACKKSGEMGRFDNLDMHKAVTTDQTGSFRLITTRKAWQCNKCLGQFKKGTKAWHYSNWIIGGQATRYCEFCWPAMH